MTFAMERIVSRVSGLGSLAEIEDEIKNVMDSLRQYSTL